MMSRKDLKNSAAKWLEGHLLQNYQGTNWKIFLDANLAMMPELRGYQNHNLLKFKVDVIAIIKDSSGEINLLMINIMNYGSSIGLKHILEMRMMCQAAKPLEAYLFSTDGLSRPIQAMMYSQNRDKNSLKYSDNAYLEVWRFNADRSELDGNRPILPY